MAINRNIFAVHHVPTGAPMWYDKDSTASPPNSRELGEKVGYIGGSPTPANKQDKRTTPREVISDSVTIKKGITNNPVETVRRPSPTTEMMTQSELHSNVQSAAEMTAPPVSDKKAGRFQKGCIPWNKGKKGVQVAWNKGLPKEMQPRYGKKHSEATKVLMSEIRKKRWQEAGYREKVVESIRKRAREEEYRRRVAEGRRKAWSCKSDEEKKEHSNLMRKIALARFSNEEERKEQSERIKKLWSNPDYARKQLSRQGVHPNKKEILLYRFLQQNWPNKFALNVLGDKLVLGGKIPDFVSIDGTKKLIELFGNYWHDKIEEEERIEFFRAFGYDTLVIWEEELKDLNKLKNKIELFIRNWE